MRDPALIRIARTLRKRDTWAEKLLWRWLRDRRFAAYKFRRQHPFGPHFLDFFCIEALLDIELDGFQHGFPERQKADAQRDIWLEANGVKVLRFGNRTLVRGSWSRCMRKRETRLSMNQAAARRALFVHRISLTPPFMGVLKPTGGCLTVLTVSRRGGQAAKRRWGC